MKCPECQSEKVYIFKPLDTDEEYECASCGMLWKFPQETGAVNCPHCNTADNITVEEGREWCSRCGLDPNDIPESEEIAHLYKGTIRRLLGEGKLAASTNMGKFVRSSCGPHCRYGNTCSQSSAFLSFCIRQAREDKDFPYDEEISANIDDTGTMGKSKSKRQKKKEEKRRRIEEQKRNKQEAAKAEKKYKAEHIAEFRCANFESFMQSINHVKSPSNDSIQPNNTTESRSAAKVLLEGFVNYD